MICMRELSFGSITRHRNKNTAEKESERLVSRGFTWKAATQKGPSRIVSVTCKLIIEI